MRKLSLLVSVLLVFGWSSGALAVPSNNPITGGLVAAYEFTGNANDVSGSGNHGTVIGATLTTDRFGNPNSAYLFDSDIDRIEISPVFSGDQDPITFSAWVKIQDIGGTIYGGFTYYGETRNFFKAYASGALTFDQYHPAGGGVDVEIGLENYVQQWAHVVLTKESDVVSGYLNGAFISSVTHTETYSGPSSTMAAIGNRFNYFSGGWGDRNFDGSMDDVYIYNRALSASEVSTLYSVVPEPSTALLLGIGMMGLGMRRRRRTRRVL
jgi:hypothetical protein